MHFNTANLENYILELYYIAVLFFLRVQYMQDNSFLTSPSCYSKKDLSHIPYSAVLLDFFFFAASSPVHCSFVNYTKCAAELVTGTHWPPRQAQKFYSPLANSKTKQNKFKTIVFWFQWTRFSCLLHFFQYFCGLKHLATATRKIGVGKYGDHPGMYIHRSEKSIFICLHTVIPKLFCELFSDS